MGQHCRPATHADVRDHASRVQSHAAVVSPVTVLAPEETPTNNWELEVVVEAPDRNAPPEGIYHALLAREFVPRSVDNQGPDHFVLVAVQHR
jgi:hypothetical protein